MHFLKIENPGVCSPELFTVLGTSLADTSNDKNVIGFGSGGKNSTALLLRHELPPVIFSGKKRLDFGVARKVIEDELASKEVFQVTVAYNGGNPKELDYVIDFGRHDWDSPVLALREFVSNAIDRCVRESGNWDKVRIELVGDNQVRARANHTRVFVPAGPEIVEFFKHLGKWFLHFSEPKLLKETILPKNGRNLGDSQVAVIYRRGVRVREFLSDSAPSLFDYNLSDLPIDEARKASDWDVRHHCARALAAADSKILGQLFTRLLGGGQAVWEAGFDAYGLKPHYSDSEAEKARRAANWKEGLELAGGPHAVLTDTSSARHVTRKGLTPVLAADNIVAAALEYGVKTPTTVLSSDESAGRDILPPTWAAQAALDQAWYYIERAGLTKGKLKPTAKCYRSEAKEAEESCGFERNGVIYLHVDAVNGDSVSTPALQTALEGCAHYVSGAVGSSIQYERYLLELAVELGIRVLR